MLHWQIDYHRILSSTQTYLKSDPNSFPQGTVVVAQEQEVGVGRKGDRWDSQKGGLYASFLLRPDHLLNELPLVLLRALHQTLEDLSGQSLLVKSPNDILYQDKKVSGLLIDAQITGNRADHYICGFGVNVNQCFFPDHLQACSLFQMTHKQYSIGLVLAKILICFQELYEQYLLSQVSFCRESVSLLPWLEYNEIIEKWKV